MLGRLLFSSFLLLMGFSQAGCARPKYEVAQAAQPGAAAPSEKISDCVLKFSKSQYCLEWRWEKLPTSSEMGSLTFKILRANLFDQSVVHVELDTVPELILWMPSMGHGSSPVQIEQLDVGTYRANNVFFVMPGEWELKFQIKNGNQVEDEAISALTI